MKRFEFDSLYRFAAVPDEILRDKATTEALTSQVDADRHPSQPKRSGAANLGPGPTAIANECNDRNVATCASGAAAVLSLKAAAQSAPARRAAQGSIVLKSSCCFRRQAVAPATKSRSIARYARRTISRRTFMAFGGLALAGMLSLAQAAPVSFEVPLVSAQQVPPVQTPGSGSAKLTYDPSRCEGFGGPGHECRNRSCLGPNTIGLVNLTDGITLSASGALETDAFAAGGIGVVSQSGGILGATLSRATAAGIGLSKLVSTSNEADLDMADFVDYLIEDAGASARPLLSVALSPRAFVARHRRSDVGNRAVYGRTARSRTVSRGCASCSGCGKAGRRVQDRTLGIGRALGGLAYRCARGL